VNLVLIASCHAMNRSFHKASLLGHKFLVYVDDGGIIGTPDAIKEVISALDKLLKVKTIGKMEKFDGCHIIDTVAKDGVWIHQPDLLKNLKENFKNMQGDTKRTYTTPSAPKTLILRPKQR
jgi:hypothetical protein